MKSIWVGISTALALAGVLTGTFLALSARIERRAISSSPTLFRGRPYVMKIHDYDSGRKSVLDANVMVELVQSGSLFATYTVDLISDPWCKSLPKEASMDLEMSSIPTPLVSGTFGPMSNPKLNLSIPDNLDLTGRDFCIVISNDRRPSHSLTDAAKANVVARFHVRTGRNKAFKFMYEPDYQPVVMAIAFVIGFAVVFIPLVATSKSSRIYGRKNIYLGSNKTKSIEGKTNRYEGLHHRARGRNQYRSGIKPEDDEIKLEKIPNISDLNAHSPKVDDEHRQANVEKIDGDPAFDIPNPKTSNESVDEHQRQVEDITDEQNAEDGNAVDGQSDKTAFEDSQQADEASDKASSDADYLVI